MRVTLVLLALVLTAASGNDNACAANQDPKPSKAPASTEAQREKKDRGDLSMLLDGAEWAAKSASARLREGTLKISASRIDGSPSTSMVRQAIDLDIADFDGPGTYTLGMSSMFSVVGFEAGAAEQSDMNQQLADVLSKASMVRLQNAEVVIDSVGDKEISGHFAPGELRSMSGEPISITEGKFRAIVKE